MTVIVGNSSVGDCSVPGTVFDLHGCACSEQDAQQALVVFGIIIHIVGSVGINTGQNMQAMGLVAMPMEERGKCSSLLKSRMWLIGCALFVSCAMFNFAALMFAPASILVPLEAVQFVCNVGFAKVVRKIYVPFRMVMGVVAMCIGVFLVVFFGERGTFCFDETDLKQMWEGWGWWVYLFLTLGISIVCLVAHDRCWKARAAGSPYKNADLLMPVLYALPSSLLGGGQMIVHSKLLSELLEIMATTDPATPGYTIPIAGWFFWLEAVLVSVFGVFWFFRLTQSLGLYEPLFIIPLMQSNFIVFGGIAGGIFFGEFRNLHVGLWGVGNWIMYILGLAMILIGLYFVRPVAVPEDEMDGSTCTSGGTSLAPAQALPKGGSYPSGVSPNGKPPSGAPAAKGWTDGDVTPTESVMSADNTTVVETFAVNDL